MPLLSSQGNRSAGGSFLDAAYASESAMTPLSMSMSCQSSRADVSLMVLL